VDWIHQAQDGDSCDPFGFHKRQVISNLSERLVAFQEGKKDSATAQWVSDSILSFK
jgi:hypothetical protein